jgi:IS5 family transposase
LPGIGAKAPKPGDIMKPKLQHTHQAELFRARLEQILNHRHPLYRLSQEIDWDFFIMEFGPLYVERIGRPGLPIRLLVGLHYLKHTYNESDESVVARFIENPYWQYFCGFEYFQHDLPLDPTSLVKWRKRIGSAGMEHLLKGTLETAKRKKHLTERHVQKVNADTTVQEKAIAFPTDARLYHKARVALVRMARERGIELRQTYKRLGKRALIMSGRYTHARQARRSKKETKKLRIYLGRIMRDIGRKCPMPDEALKQLLVLAERIYSQKREDKNKIYSLHAPEVECIAKGKVHKKYEFGCKVSMLTTSEDNWIIGMQAWHDNPYDGHTLKAALSQSRRLLGWKVKEAFCDKGFRGVPEIIAGTLVHITKRKQKGLSPSIWKWFKRRNAIEPIFGHLKSDNKLDRNYLKGKEGDKINAILAACGYNLRKLLRAFLFWLSKNRFQCCFSQ